LLTVCVLFASFFYVIVGDVKYVAHFHAFVFQHAIYTKSRAGRHCYSCWFDSGF